MALNEHVRLFARIANNCRAMFHRRRAEADLDEELREFFAAAVERNVQSGMPHAEAVRSAKLALGSTALTKDRVRDVGWESKWDSVRQDLRYALRSMHARPTVPIVLSATLAIGIGLNAAMFSVVDAVLLRPLDYPDADRLVWMANYDRRFDLDTMMSRSDFVIWRERSTAFERMAAYNLLDLAVVTPEQASKERVAAVTEDFWSITGAEPRLGRLFVPGERNVIVLSNELFERRFGGNPGAIGNVLELDGYPVTIVGVLSRGFKFTFPRGPGSDSTAPVAYIPIPSMPGVPGFADVANAATGPVPPWVRVVGRIKPGIPFDQAVVELRGIYNQIAAQHPSFFRHDGLKVVRFKEKVVGRVSRALTILAAAVAFVLLITIANVSHLLLARAATRQREMAIRVSLGAGRARVIRQLLTESVLLAAIGGGAGLLLAHLSVRGIVQWWPEAVPRLDEVSVNERVVAFTACVALLSSVLFGMGPGLALLKTDVSNALKANEATAFQSRGGGRIRRWLVASELALASMLLVGAALMVKSLWLMSAGSPDFARHTLVTSVSLAGPRYESRIPQEEYAQELLRRVSVAPGVAVAGIDAGSFTFPVRIDGVSPVTESGEPSAATFRPVTLGYFKSMGVPLVKGRWPSESAFTSGDVESIDAIVVNERFVRTLSSNVDPIGRHISGPFVSGTIAGVVADIKEWQLDADPLPQIYVPYRRAMILRQIRMVIRTNAAPFAAVPGIRGAIEEVDRTQPAKEMATLAGVLSSSVAPRRFSLFMLGSFAAVALILSLIGTYGMIAYAISQRTREIGIRLALGATPNAVVALVARRETGVVVSGIAAGLAGASAAAPAAASLLYQIEPHDLATFAAVGGALILTAVVTCWLAAARAAFVEPLVALRSD